jgi:hypothetical protein
MCSDRRVGWRSGAFSSRCAGNAFPALPIRRTLADRSSCKCALDIAAFVKRRGDMLRFRTPEDIYQVLDLPVLMRPPAASN